MIVFGSRGSDLALTQTRWVAERLTEATGEPYRIEVIETRGDRTLDTPLPLLGGKGLFTAELEQALRQGRIDAAVHSLKDLPVEDAPGLALGAIPVRQDPRDVLIYQPRAHDPEGGTLPLRPGARVGTGSPRRIAAARTLRSDLELLDIRGNVDTRLRKLAQGDYDAIVLAAAGLARLGIETPGLARCYLPTETFTPAPGQGALGVQCRGDDARTKAHLRRIHDPHTAACVLAERQVLNALGGGCSMPFGALAWAADSRVHLRAQLLSTDGIGGFAVELTGDDLPDLAAQAADQLAPLLGAPLDGIHLALLRPGGSSSRLARALALAGAQVETVAVSETLPLDGGALDATDCAAVAVTSTRAVDRLCEEAAARGIALGDLRWFAVGAATAEAARRRGFDCAMPSDEANGAALARMIGHELARGARVLFPCALERHDALENGLADAGIAVRAVPLYRTQALQGIELPAADCVVFTSPSAVGATEPPAASTRAIALGDTTAAAMREAGLTVHGVAELPTPQALVPLLRDILSNAP